MAWTSPSHSFQGEKRPSNATQAFQEKKEKSSQAKAEKERHEDEQEKNGRIHVITEIPP